MDPESPFAGILVGQPTLRRRLRFGSFAALDQRIGLRYEIPGMDQKETVAYLRHQLALAGHDAALFSDDAIALIHQAGRGVPRLVNNLATQVLVAAYAERKAIVDESAARAVVTEVTAEEIPDAAVKLPSWRVMAADDLPVVDGSGGQHAASPSARVDRSSCASIPAP